MHQLTSPARVPLPRLLAAVLTLALTGILTTLGTVVPAHAYSEPTLPRGAWPLQPRPQVVEGFDPPASAWGAGHRGVDLRGRAGQVVRAAAAGTVAFAGSIAGRGVVTVDHGGVRTTYEPVHVDVSVGDRVARGQRLGTLRLMASHCFPSACLHWGLIRGDAYLDPLRLVGLGPVRLLPLDRQLPAGQAGLALSRDAGSGARVRLLVGLAQAVGGHVGVDLGRGQ